MAKEILRSAVIINDECTGRAGVATTPNESGNVMFYPNEGMHPYRICKSLSDIEYIND